MKIGFDEIGKLKWNDVERIGERMLRNKEDRWEIKKEELIIGECEDISYFEIVEIGCFGGFIYGDDKMGKS